MMGAGIDFIITGAVFSKINNSPAGPLRNQTDAGGIQKNQIIIQSRIFFFTNIFPINVTHGLFLFMFKGYFGTTPNLEYNMLFCGYFI
jgi:hypothetical protein